MTTFFSLGDWGQLGPTLDRVSDQAASWAQRVRPSFVLLLGDNFYERGVSGTDDPLWEQVFEEKLAARLPPTVRFHPVLGNHDYLQDPEAQVLYSRKNARWDMPARYYTKFVPLSTDATLQIVFVDTVTLVPGSAPTPFPSEFFLRGRQQLLWLEKTLGDSCADFLVVAGHFPVLSDGMHGDVLKKALQPLLERHHVSLYLCGHDHSLQHFHENGVHYLVNGTGARPAYARRRHRAPFYSTAPGFVVHTYSPASRSLENSFVDARSGKVLHTVTVPPRRRA